MYILNNLENIKWIKKRKKISISYDYQRQEIFIKRYREQFNVPRSLVTWSTANRVMRITFQRCLAPGESAHALARPYIFTLAHVSSPFVEQPSPGTIRGTRREKRRAPAHFSRYNDASSPSFIGGRNGDTMMRTVMHYVYSRACETR